MRKALDAYKMDAILQVAINKYSCMAKQLNLICEHINPPAFNHQVIDVSWAARRGWKTIARGHLLHNLHVNISTLN